MQNGWDVGKETWGWGLSRLSSGFDTVVKDTGASRLSARHPRDLTRPLGLWDSCCGSKQRLLMQQHPKEGKGSFTPRGPSQE